MINPPREDFLRWHFPAYVWMAAIFIVSSIPGAYLPEEPVSGFSRIVHFFEYAVLGALIFRAISRSKHKLLGNAVIASVLLASLYAATDEIHQYFVPGRCMDIIDWIFDFLGAVSGAVLYYKRNAWQI